MDFDLTEEQRALVDGVQAVLRPHENPTAAERRRFCCYRPDLQLAFQDGGYTGIRAHGLGPLDAALVAMTAAHSPCVAEVANSTLIWPSVLDGTPEGPVAFIAGDAARPARFLAVARHALIDTGHDLVLLDLAARDVKPVETILAYPYGRLADPALARRGRTLGAAARATARVWARIALAVEFAAAAERAVAFTVDYVKQRHAFGRPIGSFQAVQHRLAQCHQIAGGLRYTALYAAWAGTEMAANVAAHQAQRHAGKLAFDLHQFNGGMGVTNEHGLHLWTYRLRALQGELGGAQGAALALANALWPEEEKAGGAVPAPPDPPSSIERDTKIDGGSGGDGSSHPALLRHEVNS